LLINVLCLIFIGIRLEQEFGFGKWKHCLHFLTEPSWIQQKQREELNPIILIIVLLRF
jgi:hypothetical protein